MARPITANPPTNTPEGKKEYMKLWWEENKLKKKKYDAEYHARHKEVRNKVSIDYYYANKDVIRERMKEYNKVNKEKLMPMWQKHYRKRRAKLAGVMSEPYTKIEIHTRDGGMCYICNENIPLSVKWPSPMSFSFDHIKPLSKGGDDTKNNIKSAHLVCNMRKATKVYEGALQ